MEAVPRNLKILTGITVALFLLALYMVFIYAPRELVMGDVQRVFYFHVATGWVGAVAFLVTAIAGGVYLAKRERKWDRLAESSVEVGLVFTLINIAMVGTLLSAMAVQARTREILLPILLFPVVLPVLVAAVKATSGILQGFPLEDYQAWLSLLIAYDTIFLGVAIASFDYVVEE